MGKLFLGNETALRHVILRKTENIFYGCFISPWSFSKKIKITLHTTRKSSFFKFILHDAGANFFIHTHFEPGHRNSPVLAARCFHYTKWFSLEPSNPCSRFRRLTRAKIFFIQQRKLFKTITKRLLLVTQFTLHVYGWLEGVYDTLGVMPVFGCRLAGISL